MRCAVIGLLFVLSAGFGATAQAAETDQPSIFFAPQSMNETNEILVPIYARNIPKDYDGLCGTEFRFAYDVSQFDLKLDEAGRPALGTTPAMLVQNTGQINVSARDGVVSVSYVDFGGGQNLVLRDGPLFYFTLLPKYPDALWNSDDVYPLRFLPGSVNLVVLDRRNNSFWGWPTDGIDTYISGYNVFPTFEGPTLTDKLELVTGNPSMWVNGVEIPNGAAPYEREGSLMVPVRFLAEAIGMELDWDDASQTAALYWPYQTAYLAMNQKAVYLNARLREDLPAPEELDGRTYIDLSVVQAIFGDDMEIQREGMVTVFQFKEGSKD